MAKTLALFIFLAGVVAGHILSKSGVVTTAEGAIRTITKQYDDTNVVFTRLIQERAPSGGAIRLLGCGYVPTTDGGVMGLDKECVPCGTVTGATTVAAMATQCLPLFQSANNL